jgi:hypothetical protein
VRLRPRLVCVGTPDGRRRDPPAVPRRGVADVSKVCAALELAWNREIVTVRKIAELLTRGQVPRTCSPRTRRAGQAIKAAVSVRSKFPAQRPRYEAGGLAWSSSWPATRPSQISPRL